MSEQFVQFNRLEGSIADIRTSGHSGLMAFANDAQKLVYQEGPSKVEHLYSDDTQITALSGWFQSQITPFEIGSFTSNIGATTILINTGEWKAIGAISFSASYTNGTPTGGYVSHTGWSNLNLAGYTGPTVNIEAVNYPSVGSTKAFTLNATDGITSDTSTLTYYFYNYKFYGVSTATTYTESDVEGLATSSLSNSKAATFTVAPGASEYIVYAYPSRLGVATFTVGGFEGGFESPETVSITNSNAYTEDYYVYRSTNTNLGSTTVSAS